MFGGKAEPRHAGLNQMANEIQLRLIKPLLTLATETLVPGAWLPLSRSLPCELSSPHLTSLLNKNEREHRQRQYPGLRQ